MIAYSHSPLALETVALGFALGLRHATEADHLVAVSTLVAEHRSWRKALSAGALWGVGHTSSLLIAALCFIGFGIHPSRAWGERLELLVGLIIIALGLRLVIRAMRGQVHRHVHRHGAMVHTHFHTAASHEPAEGSHHAVRRSSLLVGMIHGLAGSAALMLAVASTIQSPWLALGYVAIFGVGSIGGMMVMSSVISLPLSSGFFLQRRMQIMVGLAGAVFGAYYVSAVW